jgi:hypothetical protein
MPEIITRTYRVSSWGVELRYYVSLGSIADLELLKRRALEEAEKHGFYRYFDNPTETVQYNRNGIYLSWYIRPETAFDLTAVIELLEKVKFHASKS